MLDRAADAPGCDGIIVDRTASSVTLPRDVEIDPGGLGKGLAADLVTAELLAAGARGVLVNLGGDLRVAATHRAERRGPSPSSTRRIRLGRSSNWGSPTPRSRRRRAHGGDGSAELVSAITSSIRAPATRLIRRWSRSPSSPTTGGGPRPRPKRSSSQERRRRASRCPVSTWPPSTPAELSNTRPNSRRWSCELATRLVRRARSGILAWLLLSASVIWGLLLSTDSSSAGRRPAGCSTSTGSSVAWPRRSWASTSSVSSRTTTSSHARNPRPLRGRRARARYWRARRRSRRLRLSGGSA